MIVYSDNTKRALVFKMPKMSGYVMIFKVKEGNNKLMSFYIGSEKQLEK